MYSLFIRPKSMHLMLSFKEDHSLFETHTHRFIDGLSILVYWGGGRLHVHDTQRWSWSRKTESEFATLVLPCCMFIWFYVFTVVSLLLTSTKKVWYSPRSLCLLAGLYGCLFVSKITQKTLNGFPQNLVKGCSMCQEKTHWVFVQIRMSICYISLLFIYTVYICYYFHIMDYQASQERKHIQKSSPPNFGRLICLLLFNLSHHALHGYSHLQCVSQSAACLMSQRRIEPLLLL